MEILDLREGGGETGAVNRCRMERDRGVHREAESDGERWSEERKREREREMR